MFVSINCDVALFRTPFNATHDLVQKFRGVNNQSLSYNAPVDFMEAGLIDNSKWDYWHVDIPFNYSNDEASPFFFITKENKSSIIGANHGHYCAVNVLSINHGKTYADVGSLWQDQSGTEFTLIRVTDENSLQFLSKNVGKSETDFDFISTINGDLTYISNGQNQTSITIEKQYRCYLSRSNRYLKKEIITYKKGVASPLFGGAECDYAEIHEHYLIINPATVAEDLRNKRPVDGYSQEVDLANYGKPLVDLDLIYRVMPDGAILTIAKAKKVADIKVKHYHLVMVQEKLDAFGGGMYRYIPKILPLDCEEGVIDFTNPVPLYGKPYPSLKKVTKEYWQDPNSPPDRAIDFFKDKQGKTRLGFASGFLPVFDGAPEIRKNNIESAINLKGTRKFYPNICDDMENLVAVGYKKFFIPQNEQSVYTLEYDGKKYIYVDLFEKSTIQVDIEGGVKLLESRNVVWTQDCKSLTVSGEKGYAVFVCEQYL